MHRGKWFLALIITFVAAACQLRTAPADGFAAPPRRPSEPPSSVPFLVVALSYLFLAVVSLCAVRFGSLEGVLAGAVALAVLASARQVIAMRDFTRLAIRHEELATIDGMTGVHNRRHFMEAAEAACTRAPAPPAARRDDDRRGLLQGDQRRARPRGGRPGAHRTCAVLPGARAPR